MDRNTFTGLALMFALLLGYQWYIAPTEEEVAAWEAQQAQTQAQEDSLATRATLDAEAAANALSVLQNGNYADSTAMSQELARRFGPFGQAVAGLDRDVVLRNNKVEVTLNTRGGMPISAVLQDGYKRYGS